MGSHSAPPCDLLQRNEKKKALVRAYDTGSDGVRVNVFETLGTGQEGVELIVRSRAQLDPT